MSYEQLARVFPDGKSVDLAADGRALPRYEEARAEIAAHGGVASESRSRRGRNLFRWLFGNHEQDREEEAIAASEAAPGARPAEPSKSPAAPAPAHMTAAERRAARAAAVAAPAVAAIEAARRKRRPAAGADRGARRREISTQVAALARRRPRRRARRTPAPMQDAAADACQGRRKKRQGAGRRAGADAAGASRRSRRLCRRADAAEPPRGLVHLAALTPQGAGEARTAAPKADAAKINAPAATNSAKADTAKAEAAKPDPIARLALAASLPVVITRGPKDQQGLPAERSRLRRDAPPRRPARRDDAASGIGERGRARNRIGAARQVEFRRTDQRDADGRGAARIGARPGLYGLRQAAHIIPDALSATSAGYKIAFNAAAGLLDCAHFTKSAASAPTLAANSVSISEASAAKANWAGLSVRPGSVSGKETALMAGPSGADDLQCRPERPF